MAGLNNGLLGVSRLTIVSYLLITSHCWLVASEVGRDEVEDGGAKGWRSARGRLRSHLLSDYDKLSHPVLNASHPVRVSVGVAIIHLDVDEMASVMSMHVWMRLAWQDEHLQWRPDDFDGLEQVHFGAEELWRPDVFLYNSAAEENFEHYGHTHFLVNKEGEVLWVPPAHLKAFCKLNLRLWPRDTQRCKLKFGSWTSHGDQIDLALYNNATKADMLNFYTDNREWRVLWSTAKQNNVTYACCPENYPDVTFEFALERTSGSYTVLIILPCLITVVISLCSFLLPPDSGVEKIVLNATALLVCAMYLIYFANNLPFHVSGTPVIVLFFADTAALAGLAVVINVACLAMVRERRFTPPPPYLIQIFSSNLGKMLCLGHYYHQVSATHERLGVEMTEMAESEQGHQHEDGSTLSSAMMDPDESHLSNNGVNVAHVFSGSKITHDWMLVAKGLERIALILYGLCLAIMVSVFL